MALRMSPARSVWWDPTCTTLSVTTTASPATDPEVLGTRLPGPFTTAAELRELLPFARALPGRAPYYVRLWTPLAKVVQRLRGNRRITPERPAREVAG